MNLNITVNEAASPAPEANGTHNVRVFYNELDGGQVSGPFSLSVAQQTAGAVLLRSGVLRANVEPVS